MIVQKTTTSGRVVDVDTLRVDCVFPLAGRKACRVICADGAKYDIEGSGFGLVSDFGLASTIVPFPRHPASGVSPAGNEVYLLPGCMLATFDIANGTQVTLRGEAYMNVGAPSVLVSAALQTVPGGGPLSGSRILGAFVADGIGGFFGEVPAGIVTYPGGYALGSGVYKYQLAPGILQPGEVLFPLVNVSSDDCIGKVIPQISPVDFIVEMHTSDGYVPRDGIHFGVLFAVRP